MWSACASPTITRALSKRLRAIRLSGISKCHGRFQSSTKETQPGLFSIPGLHVPADFRRLTKQAIIKSDDIRASIPETIHSKSQAVETLYQLDGISRTVCNVIDAAELCRSAHASAEWRDAANETFQELQQYMATLNGDQKLYQSLVVVDREYASDLTEEESRFCFLLKSEFEVDGIHLPDNERDHVQTLHHHVVNLETLWMTNITNSRKSFWTDAALVESVLPKPVLQANGAVYSSDDPTKVQLITDSPIANSISSFASNGDLRKQVHWESATNTPENLEVLDALIQQRHELATALGFDNFAARSLQDKMARTPRAVNSFLQDLEHKIRPQFLADLELLGNVKKQVEGNSNIEPWDIKFYTKLVRAQTGIDPNDLAPFLGLDNCLRALKLLIRDLFGIEVKEQDMLPGEGWDVDDTTGKMSTTTGDRIRKFTFSDLATEQPLGTMYLDLHSRPGKYTHAAHFTVRCGCRIDGPDSDFQLPVVALVCNMNSGIATLTSHAEVETLFHEMGHALHSLLSRTNFQHMAGTRAAMDFVETPSHWMEHYVWDPDFLPILCQSAATGQVLPDQTIKQLVTSRSKFRCLEMQSQIILSKFDQEIFGGPAVPGRPGELWQELHKQHQVPVLAGTHWYTNVGHFVTYGAGYYGYLYSQVFADAIWRELFAGRPLDKSSGQKLWKNVLIHGGARDPQVMLKDLLGHEPTIDGYVTGNNR